MIKKHFLPSENKGSIYTPKGLEYKMCKFDSRLTE